MNTFKEVPEWNIYYPSLYSATSEQKKFYEYWLTQLEKGNFVDIDGNLSYIFVYLYSVIKRFIKDKDLNHLLRCFNAINNVYGEYEKIRQYLMIWGADAYLHLDNYDKAWELMRGTKLRIDVADVISLRAKCKDTSIDGQDLMCTLMDDNDLTNFGKEHQMEIAELATIFLEDFHKEHGKNLIEYFCRQFDFSNLTEDDFSRLKEFYSDEKEFIRFKKFYEEDKKRPPNTFKLGLFRGIVMMDNPSTNFEYERIPLIITSALVTEGKRILRECENTYREERNLPKVGEGWINEAELFYKICEEFPYEKIVHHGRPSWLSPQHLDIYFTLKNIGIEYQGLQHQEPVEYFGGENAFEKQQKRDIKKRILCGRNGCKLIYVYERYDFEEVKRKIKNSL